MNKYFLLLFCSFIALATHAQKDMSKYLAGAVPEVNGKVLFTRSIPTNSAVNDNQLFSLMEKWAKQNYEKTDGDLQNRILLANPDKKNIACSGEKFLIFQSSALSLDRAKMSYQLILEISNGKCDVTVRNIRYDYAESKHPLPAEDLITDKVALNKDKSKLNRYYDKFRTHTVDSINGIFNAIDLYLNGSSTTGAISAATSPAPVVIPAVKIQEPQPVIDATDVPIVSAAQQTALPIVTQDNAIAVQSMAGYKQVSAEKIPGNIVKLLSEAMLITSGTAEQTNVMAASWGGLGRFWEKAVAFCFLNPSRYSVQTMDKGDTYTLSFYTEAYKDAVMYCGSVSGRNTDKIKQSGLTPIKTPSGATAFSEAWMIIECKKIVAQPISPDAVVAKDLPNDWTKNGYHKMYIGEILNVWIK